MGKPGTKPGSTIVTHGIGARYEEQAISPDTIRNINYAPGTRLKVECGRRNHKDGKNELYWIKFCKVVEDYPLYLLCEFEHKKGGTYFEAINKVDICCKDVFITELT